jgi:hypothetical protein
MSAWTLYLVTRLDAIQEFAHIGAAISALVCFWSLVVVLVSACNIADGDKPWGSTAGVVETSMVAMRYARRTLKWNVSFFVLFCVISVVTPTTQQAAVILVVPAIANNENIQREAGDIYKLAKEYLEKQVKEKP